MKWKYGHCVAPCYCGDNKPKMINFTTLTPMDNKCLIDDNMIDKVGEMLKSIGFDFWSCSVMLINHKHIDKNVIIKLLSTLNQEVI